MEAAAEVDVLLVEGLAALAALALGSCVSLVDDGLLLASLLALLLLVVGCGFDGAGLSGFYDKFEDFEGVRVFGCCCRNAKGVSRWQGNLSLLHTECYSHDWYAYLVARKAELVINSHLKGRVRLLQTHNRRPTQVPVRVIAMAKCQAVYASVALVVRCTIVEEPSDTTTLDTS